MSRYDGGRRDQFRRRSRSRSPPSRSSTSNTRENRMSNLKSLKEELKNAQAEREFTGTDGSDFKNSSSTPGTSSNSNLYIQGLPETVNEETATQLFGKFGALASVKIMWPRNEQERARSQNRGNAAFILFMNRDSAQEALNNFDGKVIEEKQLKVQFGKTVMMPEEPCFVPDELKKRLTPPEITDKPFNCILSSSKNSEISEACVKVVIPENKQVKLLIHRTIEFVLKHGAKFEKSMIAKESKNPAFKFLYDYNSNEHVYYRWRIWSLAHGESVTAWSEEPYRMTPDGPFWLPPPVDVYAMPGQKERLLGGSKSEDNEVQESKNVDPKTAKVNKLNETLKKVYQKIADLKKPDREKIGELMVLFIDNAEYATMLSSTLVGCFRSILDIDPIQGLSWLFLIHDILSNIEHTRYGNKYKSDFESYLPAIFGCLGKVCNVSGIGNAKLRKFKEGVSSIIDNWNHLGLFDITVLQRGARIFNGTESLKPREVLPMANKGMMNALNGKSGKSKNEQKIDKHLESLPPSVQKSVLRARVTSDTGAINEISAKIDIDNDNEDDDDEDDIDGVPLFDTRWKPKDQKREEMERERLKTEADLKKKEIAAGSGGGFKRSAFQEVDLGQEEVVISTAFGGTTVIEKRKRCEIEADQLREKAVEGKGIAQISELERIELENRRIGESRRNSD